MKNPRLYLIRHAEAAAGFVEAADPGLSTRGDAQAQRVAEALASIGPLPVLSSPLARAVETARPTASAWNREIEIAPCVSEIPSAGMALEDRHAWLQTIMRGQWKMAGAPVQRWRDHLIAYLVSRPTACVIFTHFVAINGAVGAALGSDDVLCFHPDNCSVTVLDVDNGALRLVAKGADAKTNVG